MLSLRRVQDKNEYRLDSNENKSLFIGESVMLSLVCTDEGASPVKGAWGLHLFEACAKLGDWTILKLAPLK